jgi:type II secretory pathway pseudopilin PulG
MTTPTPTRRSKPSEEGYILIWVILLVALFSLALSVAIPRIAKEIQLDRERETMQRGKQYRRAVQLYYRKFHAYPPNLDALVKTNEIRFLRKKYVDPTTGKDDWKPIHLGENKAPTAMGFFGQPLAGNASSIAGTGPSGGNGINGASPIGSGSSFGGSSLFAAPDTGTNPAAPTSAPGAAPGATTTPGAPGTPGTTGTAGTNGTSSSDTGLTGQTFGGAGIIGFEPASSKSSILIYKKKTHYNEWEFVYDPLQEMQTIPGSSGNIGQPASNTTTPIGGSGIGGSGIGGSGIGGSGIGGSGIGGSGIGGPGSGPASAPTGPIAPITPTPPEQ